MSLFDAATGSALYAVTGSSTNERLQFRIRIEMAAPVGLLPKPKRYVARAPAFGGVVEIPTGSVLTDEKSPVQYQLLGLQNMI